MGKGEEGGGQRRQGGRREEEMEEGEGLIGREEDSGVEMGSMEVHRRQEGG